MVVEVKTMEVKNTQQLTSPTPAFSAQAAEAKAAQWKNFLGDVKSEFGKISWTSADELRTYTKIVVGATFSFGMGIYLMDVVIQTLLSGLAAFVRLIGG